MLKWFVQVTIFQTPVIDKKNTTMDTLQLSASSSTTQGATLPQRRRVCRSLFGPVDHEKLDRELDAKQREITEKYQERWNFDFASGTPLHGEFDWERSSEDETPAFYQESVQAEETRTAALPNKAVPHRESSARRGATNRAVSTETTRTGKLSCKKKKTDTRLGTTTARSTGFSIKRKKQEDIKPRESTPKNPLRF